MKRSSFLIILCVLVSVLGGCREPGTGPDPNPAQNVSFDTDNPTNQTGRSNLASADAGAAASSDASPPSTPSTDVDRLIAEADIVHLRDGRLYALSQYGGLSIVDVSVRDHLRLLGRRTIEAVPFEMYERSGVVYVMSNAYGRYEYDASTRSQRWVSSARVTAFNVSDAANIRELGRYDVPGEISDSRIVGNVLYLVSYEDGYCWNCQNAPATIVTSFNVGNPASIARVDQSVFTSPTPGYSYWRRSVTATTQRMYVAGPVWSWDGQTRPQSVIQVLDISDPNGRIVRGADVPVEGQINNRWQMDEYLGTLRVVSQDNGGWGRTGVNPVIQTFHVTSAQEITPLGRTELRLPSPESLRSVRFDGPRGYAITAQQTDPLYTIDLADPANPRQAGELVIPGWIYHMEPRGDRLVGLGFDQGNTGGSLHVSLFDVADLAHPTMIKRVNFGHGWASLSEDQNRIQKSFQVLDAQGLILVPFASYGFWRGPECVAPTSGIQLIDYSHDDLALRGIAPQHGQPRRAFIHDERLFAMSDRDLTSFDFTNRDQPARTANLELSTSAHRVIPVGTNVVALSNDWWSNEPTLSVYPATNADTSAPLGSVNLRTLAGTQSSTDCYGYGAWGSWYSARLFAHGNFVYIVVPPSQYYYYPNATGNTAMTVGVIDLRDPTHPVIAGQVQVSPTLSSGCTETWGCGVTLGDSYSYGYGYGDVLSAGSGIVQSGSTLVVLESRRLSSNWQDSTVNRALRILDLSDPAHPSLGAPVSLGSSLGDSPLQLQGSTVFTSRWTSIPDAPGRVRFWLDRINLTVPTSPVRLPAVQIPGSLLAIDQNRIAVVGYQRTTATAIDWQQCTRQSGARAWFDSTTGQCSIVHRSLKLLEIDSTSASLRQSLALPDQQLRRVLVGDDRIAFEKYPEYSYTQNGPSTIALGGGVLLASGLRSGTLRLDNALDWDGYNYGSLVAMSGTQLAVNRDHTVTVYDTSVPGALRVTGTVDVRGYGYVTDLTLESGRAVIAAGEWGLQTLTLR